MPLPQQVGTQSRMRGAAAVKWERLSFIEQNLLLAAFAEKPLWVPCASVADDQDDTSGLAVRWSARHLVSLGLVWFYRVDDGYPDLSQAEVDALFADAATWSPESDGCQQIGLYLTELGESVFPVANAQVSG